MDKPLSLVGYRFSVYTRIVRMALFEMGLEATYIEANPFGRVPDPVLETYTPFNRVPVIRHGDFTLTETGAILRYLDAIGPGLSLVPTAARQLGRMAQVIGIVDAYAYIPMVRQVFLTAVFAPHVKEPADPAMLDKGLKGAQPVLQVLDSIAAEGLQLNGSDITLADMHLAPMMAYFTMAEEGALALGEYPALDRWWHNVSDRPALLQTDPFTTG